MIHINEISRVFSGGRTGDIHALHPLSFSVKKGEIFGLLGPNGAGKTTLLRILSTVIRPTTGTAVLNDCDILRQPDAVKKSIGLLSGNTRLYGRLNARELLTYFGRLYDMSDDSIAARIEDSLTMLDITQIADRRIEKLSTGQTQRVSIARCILHDPAILLLDDSASAGKTVIFSTHYMEEAELLCNRIGFLHEGSLLAVDTLENYHRESGLGHVADIFLHYVTRGTGEAA